MNQRTKAMLIKDMNQSICPELTKVTRLFKGKITKEKIDNAITSLNKLRDDLAKSSTYIEFGSTSKYFECFHELRQLQINRDRLINRFLIDILYDLWLLIEDGKYYAIYRLRGTIQKLEKHLDNYIVK